MFRDEDHGGHYLDRTGVIDDCGDEDPFHDSAVIRWE